MESCVRKVMKTTAPACDQCGRKCSSMANSPVGSKGSPSIVVVSLSPLAPRKNKPVRAIVAVGSAKEQARSRHRRLSLRERTAFSRSERRRCGDVTLTPAQVTRETRDRNHATVATMPQVIGPYAACNFRSVVATRTPRLLGHVHDGTGEQGFIAKAGLLPELLVRPYEDCLDIRIGLRRQPVFGHGSIADDRGASTLGRPPADLADEIRELLIAFDSGTLGAVERGERLGGQAAEHCAVSPRPPSTPAPGDGAPRASLRSRSCIDLRRRGSRQIDRSDR